MKTIKVDTILLLFVLLGCHPWPSHVADNGRMENWTRRDLSKGQALLQWQPTAFQNAGEIEFHDNSIILHRGGYLTGLTWNGAVPKMNYELELDAKRVEGRDFFCGITFPFQETHASLILGGWGGYTVGISNIDGIDASENGTANAVLFEEDTWYHVRLRITPDKIEAWVDDQHVVDLHTAGKTISLRPDVDITTPLSIMTFNTSGAVKNIVLKKL